MVRINTEDIASYRIAIELGVGGLFRARVHSQHGHEINFSTGVSAWLRKPDYEFKLMCSDPTGFVQSELKATLETLYSLKGIRWLNDPYQANKAKSKVQQLVLARELGIRVPSTIITNQPKLAIEFSSYQARLALKSIYTANVFVGKASQGVPTRELSHSQLNELAQDISVVPTQIQEYIAKAFEVRVTVVGSNVFAARIDSQSVKGAESDWRLKAREIQFHYHELPTDIHNFCIKFLREQCLNFGALDFIVTDHGEYVFLENNPYGQYLWLEDLVGLPITSAICDFLTVSKIKSDFC